MRFTNKHEKTVLEWKGQDAGSAVTFHPSFSISNIGTDAKNGFQNLKKNQIENTMLFEVVFEKATRLICLTRKMLLTFAHSE